MSDELAAARREALRCRERVDRLREAMEALRAGTAAIRSHDEAAQYRSLSAAVTALEEAYALGLPERRNSAGRLLDLLLSLLRGLDDPDRLGARLIALRLRVLAAA